MIDLPKLDLRQDLSSFYTENLIIDNVDEAISWLEINNTSAVRYLEISNLEKLENFELSNQGDYLVEISLNNLPSLKLLELSYTDSLQIIRLNQLNSLKTFECENNLSLTGLEVKDLPAIEVLQLSGNILEELTFQNVTTITELDCSYNFLEHIDISSLVNLKYFDCSHNMLGDLNYSNNLELLELDCSSNAFTTMSFSGLPKLNSLNIDDHKNVNFAVSDLASLSYLRVLNIDSSRLELKELFNLTELVVEKNLKNEVYLENLPQLKTLELKANYYEYLELKNLPMDLYFNGFQDTIIHMVLKEMPNLTQYTSTGQYLEQIEFIDLPELKFVSIFNTNTRKIDYLNLPKLEMVHTIWLAIEEMVFNDLPSLEKIYLRQNPMLRMVDICGAPKVDFLDLILNDLDRLYLRNGSMIDSIYIGGFEPDTLDFICVDPIQLATFEQIPTINASYNLITDCPDCSSGVVDNDGDGFSNFEDCNDSDASIYPGAEELCDEVDNNCNGEIDEGLEMFTYYIDADGDGFGDPKLLVEDCIQPKGTALSGDDCDDSNPAINPGATEIPNNNIDEDCNGTDLMTGTHELSGAQIKIFPNPAKDLIYVNYEKGISLQFTLYDVNGRQVLQSINASEINLASITSGIYLLEVMELATNRRIFERIVISK